MKEPAFTLGIEEEYLLVDRETRDLVTDPPPALFDGCEDALGDRVTPEFLRSQIEVGTTRLPTAATRRAAISRRFRATVGEVAGPLRAGADRGLDPSLRRLVAADATPTRSATTCWRATCRALGRAAADLRHACPCRARGPELRIDLMSQVGYFLPHLLALSHLVAVLAAARIPA